MIKMQPNPDDPKMLEMIIPDCEEENYLSIGQPQGGSPQLVLSIGKRGSEKQAGAGRELGSITIERRHLLQALKTWGII